VAIRPSYRPAPWAQALMVSVLDASATDIRRKFYSKRWRVSY
jgi:hypothetical protein